MNIHWRLNQLLAAEIAVCAEVEAIIREYRARTSPGERRRAAARKWRLPLSDEQYDYNVEHEIDGAHGL